LNTNNKLNKLNHITAPNYILDYFDINELNAESLLLDIDPPRNVAKKLFWYDAQYIYGIKTDLSFEILQKIYELAFEKDNDFNKYITISNSNEDVDNNTYDLVLSRSAKNSINEAKKYIYGDYLKLVYPKISIEKHFFAVEDILECQLYKKIKFKTIQDITDKEYEEINKQILYTNLETKLIIIQHLIRNPMDVIDEIQTLRDYK